MEENDRPRRHRPSIIFPLVLIVLGLVFLFNNLGILRGELMNTIVSLWPVLLIALGIDGFVRERNIAGPTFLIGLGTFILLSNFGLISMGSWSVLLQLWPLLIVAVGLDILIGRRSTWLSGIALILVLGILATFLWLGGVVRTPAGTRLTGQNVQQSLGEISSAVVSLNPSVGSLHVSSSSNGDYLLNGRINKLRGEEVDSSYSVDGNEANYRLSSRGVVFSFGPLNIAAEGRDNWTWDVELTPNVPIELRTSLGAGQVYLALQDLNLIDLSSEFGIGETVVELPASGRVQVDISGAIGKITVFVPEGMAVRLDPDTLISGIDVPENFRKEGDYYYSPGYELAQNVADLSLGLVIGSIEIDQR